MGVDRPHARSGRLTHAVALAWGFAEATLFFIVPDVWLSRVALTRPRLALRACWVALAGALLGGAMMYGWGAAAPAGVAAALDAVPGISAADVTRVAEETARRGAVAVLLGPLTGTPYKVYAATAPAAGLGWPALLLISVPARVIRFLLVTLLTAGAVRLPGVRRLRRRSHRLLHAAVWTLFYLWYFSVKGW